MKLRDIFFSLFILLNPFATFCKENQKKLYASDSLTITNLLKQQSSIQQSIDLNSKLITHNLKELEIHKSKIFLIENEINNLKKSASNNVFIKFFLNILTVISAFFLAIFGLTETIEEIFPDNIVKRSYYLSEEPNFKNNINLFITILGLILTILITIIQIILDGNKTYIILIYLGILNLIIYLFLTKTDSNQEQSYFDKLKIAYRGIIRVIFWKFKKQYCEVCLNKCTNENLEIICLYQTENKEIEIVRFGHETCIKPCFTYFEGSNGAYSPYKIDTLNLSELQNYLNTLECEPSDEVKSKLNIIYKKNTAK